MSAAEEDRSCGTDEGGMTPNLTYTNTLISGRVPGR